MNTLKTRINNFLSKYCIFIFALLTLMLCLLHTPFWDETHAFEIARLNLSEIFQLLKVEGHTILWYLILKPFSNINLYPYSMYLINWFFCLFAIIILWKKAPFSPIQKTLITFSVPFFLYYAIIARCYSIGILFIFLICANYKKRFKKPILFSSLIILCANTNILTMVGVFYLGLIYFFEIFSKYKNNKFSKKNLLLVLSIFALGICSILIQFWGLKKGETSYSFWIINYFISFTLFPFFQNLPTFILKLVCVISFYCFNFIAFKNSKKALFFFYGTFLSLILLFFTSYSGNFWNYFIYYVYIIVLFWIFKKQLLINNFSKILFTSILFLTIFPQSLFNNGKIEQIYNSNSKTIAQQILDNENYKNSKLYTLEWWNDISPAANMYLAKHNIYIYDLHNKKKTSYESLKNIFKMKHELINFDDFYKNMDKNSYLLASNKLLNQRFINLFVSEENGDLIFKTQTKTYFLKLIESNQKAKFYIYKISEI